MDELEKSLKYVPTYQVVEQIRKEEKQIAKEAIKSERDQRKRSDKLLSTAIAMLVEKDIAIEQIAKILEIEQKEIEKILKKKNKPG